MAPTTLLLLAAAAVGVDTGWTPLDSGGYEFIIQIPPEQLDALRAGGEVGSDLPSDTGAIRSYKIVIGTGPLANQGVDLPPEARITFKQPIDGTAAPRRNEASGVRMPPTGTGQEWRGAAGATANAVQLPPGTQHSGFGLQQGTANSQGNAKTQAEISNEPLEDDDFLPGGRRPQRIITGLPAPPTDNGTNAVDTKKPSTDGDEVGPHADEDEKVANANEPETWTRSKFQWTLLVLGLIFFGGLNGYLGWLALDFRNRYLELLRDLDTQPEEDTAESSREYERAEVHDEPEEESPRELVRTAETYVGRKDGQRRRDRESSRYDDDDE